MLNVRFEPLPFTQRLVKRFTAGGTQGHQLAYSYAVLRQHQTRDRHRSSLTESLEAAREVTLQVVHDVFWQRGWHRPNETQDQRPREREMTFACS